MIGLIIGSLFFAIILGPLARLILPGKQSLSIAWTLGAGFIGAVVGGLVANWVGLSDTDDNIDWLRIAIQLGLCGGRGRADLRLPGHVVPTLGHSLRHPRPTWAGLGCGAVSDRGRATGRRTCPGREAQPC